MAKQPPQELSRFKFNEQAFQDGLSQACARALSKLGAYIMVRARTSIKRARKVDVITGRFLGRGRPRKNQAIRDATAKPGQIPMTHDRTLPRNIFFAYEPGKRSVIIGADYLTRKYRDAMSVLEHGGLTSRVRGHAGGFRTRIARYIGNPFMRPALAAEFAKAVRPSFEGSYTGKTS